MVQRTLELLEAKIKEVVTETETVRSSLSEHQSAILARVSEIEEERGESAYLDRSEFASLEKKLEDKLVNVARAQVRHT